MRITTVLFLSLMLTAPAGLGQEPKPAAKKSEKAKPAAKSDKNVFQKAESSVGDFMHRNKIWTRSEPRGTAQKKPAKKADQ